MQTPVLPSRRSPSTLAACGLVLSLGLSGCGEADVPVPRGVLLVSIDSLRADHLSCYGYESPTNPSVDTSPTIDRMLAASGTLFERAISTTSWTLPSHMAMLTGLPNELHGVRDLGLKLGSDRTLLAETFQGAGWRTGGFWSGPNLHPFFGFSRGFDTYVDCSTAAVDGVEELFTLQNDMSAADIQAKGQGLKTLHDSSHVGQTGPKLVEEFTNWFETVGADERFFAFVHMWDVHYDYEPPAEFDVFDPSYVGDETGVAVTERYPGTHPPSARNLQRILALYDGEILFTDNNVGRILGALSSAGRLDDTLIVLTSDHGEEFREHGMFGHGNTLYEESVHIPLILRYPAAIPAGEQVDVPVSLVDVAPTILSVCGFPVPAEVWGTDLQAAIRGELETRALPMERTWLRPKEGGGVAVQDLRGIHRGTHKVVRETAAAGGKTWFFDLENDPFEQDAVLSGKLGKGDPRVVEARRTWTDLDERARAIKPPADMPEDLMKGLEAAGYIGGE